ncbi:MAG TPA: MgtC/SapB family protein [Ramlibacter sp.]|jgi:putative Mg2+ transporter-C (MgtC) family protein|nr:MgtC/SapB family protein [Ramlibacter sp.]
MPVWETVTSTVAAEFSDLAEVRQLTQLALRMVIAALLGGLLGLERELRGKSAGIRTHMLLAMGAAVFVLVPLQAGMEQEALSRVIQGLLAGVGLLCAGSILKSTGDDQIYGLTTAAGLWMTTAIGVAAGMGREATAVFCTLFALGILALEGPLGRLRRGKDRA